MDRDIKRAERGDEVQPNKNCGKDIIMVIEGKAIIREARHLSYKECGVYRSLQKLQSQVKSFTQKISEADRITFIVKMNEHIVDSMILVMKAYHTKKENLDTIFDLLNKLGEKLNIIDIYIESIFNVRCISEERYIKLKATFENAIEHYTRWYSSFSRDGVSSSKD